MLYTFFYKELLVKLESRITASSLVYILRAVLIFSRSLSVSGNKSVHPLLAANVNVKLEIPTQLKLKTHHNLITLKNCYIRNKYNIVVQHKKAIAKHWSDPTCRRNRKLTLKKDNKQHLEIKHRSWKNS